MLSFPVPPTPITSFYASLYILRVHPGRGCMYAHTHVSSLYSLYGGQKLLSHVAAVRGTGVLLACVSDNAWVSAAAAAAVAERVSVCVTKKWQSLHCDTHAYSTVVFAIKGAFPSDWSKLACPA